MLALSVLLGIHGQGNKRSKLSEDTEQEEEHATQMVRHTAGQRERECHASFKVKAMEDPLLVPSALPSTVPFTRAKIKIKLSYKLHFFSSELLLQ